MVEGGIADQSPRLHLQRLRQWLQVLKLDTLAAHNIRYGLLGDGASCQTSEGLLRQSLLKHESANVTRERSDKIFCRHKIKIQQSTNA